jgi:hypothetical protein
MLVEFDLAGAEWVIVAYVSGDKNMIDVVESGKSPHVATGHLISRVPEELILKEHELLGAATDPDRLLQVRQEHMPEMFDGDFFIPRTMTIRQAGKKSNHGLNYDMRYRRFALENEMPETDAKPIVELYREVAYPGLLDYHDEVREQIKKDRTLTNLLGRKVRLMEQYGPELWDKAYSFIPQSTVFDLCRHAFNEWFRLDAHYMNLARFKGNVHDSILFSYPNQARAWDFVQFVAKIREWLSLEMEAKGRSFRLGTDVKGGPNWGSMGKIKLPEIGPGTEEELRGACLLDLAA